MVFLYMPLNCSSIPIHLFICANTVVSDGNLSQVNKFTF